MDILHDYASRAVYIYYTTLEPASRPFRSLVLSAYSQFSPLITPAMDSFVQILHSSPALVSVFILILSLLLALQVLNWLRRIMMWWVRLVFRILFWSAVVALASAVYQRGLDNTIRDLELWGGDLKRVWWQEYRRWEGVGNQNPGSRYR